MREVAGLGDSSLGSQVVLMFGQSVSQSLGLSSSQLEWLSGQSELGVVSGVEGSKGSLVLESILQLLSVLLVDGGQGSGDGLSDNLG